MWTGIAVGCSKRQVRNGERLHTYIKMPTVCQPLHSHSYNWKLCNPTQGKMPHGGSQKSRGTFQLPWPVWSIDFASEAFYLTCAMDFLGTPVKSTDPCSGACLQTHKAKIHSTLQGNHDNETRLAKYYKKKWQYVCFFIIALNNKTKEQIYEALSMITSSNKCNNINICNMTWKYMGFLLVTKS